MFSICFWILMYYLREGMSDDGFIITLLLGSMGTLITDICFGYETFKLLQLWA